jgi:hypothetical protein
MHDSWLHVIQTAAFTQACGVLHHNHPSCSKACGCAATLLSANTTCTLDLCIACLQVAVLIHGAVTTGGCAPLAGDDLAAVAEGLKVLLLLSTLMAAKGEAAQVWSCAVGPCIMQWHAPRSTHRARCVRCEHTTLTLLQRGGSGGI